LCLRHANDLADLRQGNALRVMHDGRLPPTAGSGRKRSWVHDKSRSASRRIPRLRTIRTQILGAKPRVTRRSRRQDQATTRRPGCEAHQ
jgi:hypothetical protein